jgi:TPR repeat protein
MAGAQYNLGSMIYSGQGTPKDDKQAVYWFTKAAEQGDALAQFSLGSMIYIGEGTSKDDVMAYVWWNVAAAQGSENAIKVRGLVEKELTPDQLAEAQKISKEYYANYVE